jgi:competence protein ComEC
LTVEEHPQSQWIIWNVGQGQWITHVSQSVCRHFDFGGEFNPIRRVQQYCIWRENRLILSHPDRDHYNFLKSIQARLRNVCWEGSSWRQHPPPRRLWKNLSPCKTTNPTELRLDSPRLTKSKDKNFHSQIALSKNWLIPGDATKSAEKHWLQIHPHVKSVTHLVLGHHGSKTSSSTELLEKLIHLKQCIASSRTKKYGHPHRDVRRRIRSLCSLVLTEDWHHLHYLTGE